MKTVILCHTCGGWEQSLTPLLEAAAALNGQTELWLIGSPAQLAKPIPLLDTQDGLPKPVIRLLPCLLTAPTATDCISQLQPLLEQASPRIILLDGSMLSRELATRLAFRMGGRSVTGVISVAEISDELTVTRNLYSFNLNADFIVREIPAVLSLLAHPQPVDVSEVDSLETARLVFAMGRGAGDKETRDRLYTLAGRIGASVGGTRPAVLDGCLPMERMLGISGSFAKPELCMTFGASGATPFMMGVNDSKLLVAVNRDPRALIFRYCDIGVNDSCENVLEELLKLIPD